MTTPTPEYDRLRGIATDYLEGFIDDAQDEARDNLDNVLADGLFPGEEEAFLTKVRSARILIVYPGDPMYEELDER